MLAVTTPPYLPTLLACLAPYPPLSYFIFSQQYHPSRRPIPSPPRQEMYYSSIAPCTPFPRNTPLHHTVALTPLFPLTNAPAHQALNYHVLTLTTAQHRRCSTSGPRGTTTAPRLHILLVHHYIHYTTMHRATTSLLHHITTPRHLSSTTPAPGCSLCSFL